AHYITAPMKENRDLVAFLRGLGLFETGGEESSFREEVLCREPQERVFIDGHWHDGLYPHEGETAAEKADFARFKELIEGFASRRDDQGRRAFAVPVAHA